MCRILAMTAGTPLNPQQLLEQFAKSSKNSKEYQGDGWGISYYHNDEWKTYRSLTPIWEDDLGQFPETNIMLVHARSAFRDEVQIDFNMPFETSRFSFVFNGEIRGVRLRVPGKTGAEKIFNYILRFINRGISDAVKTAIRIIGEKSDYLRASNLVILDKETKIPYVYSVYNEDPEYFTMHYLVQDHMTIVCSDQIFDADWQIIPQGEVEVML